MLWTIEIGYDDFEGEDEYILEGISLSDPDGRRKARRAGPHRRAQGGGRREGRDDP